MGTSDADLLKKSRGKTPIQWFMLGSCNFAITIENHFLRQQLEEEAFFIYNSSFSVFDVDWQTQ